MANTFDPAIGKSTRWRKGGASPNPGGRPRTRTLSELLRQKLVEVDLHDPQHRTHGERIVDNLIKIASSGDRGAIAAATEIADRVEGKVHQSLAIADVTRELQDKSDDELEFFLQYGRWPEPDWNKK